MEKQNLEQKIRQGIRNYAIDTSAKVLAYAPIMASMEAFNGLDKEQILQSRLSAAIVDAGVARVYGKVRDYVRDKFNIENSPIKSYLADTISMIGVYSPVYACILATAGADIKQISSALLMGAGIAALTACPYGKHILTPFRNKMGYKK